MRSILALENTTMTIRASSTPRRSQPKRHYFALDIAPSLRFSQSRRGNLTKADREKAERKMAQDCETTRVRIQKRKSPGLVGGNDSLEGGTKAKGQTVHVALHCGLRNHTDDVVADRVSKPDVHVLCGRQQS